MENFHDMLIRRHSIRRYTPEPIDPDQVKTILEAALLAPSSKASRPWQFVVVDDPATIAALADCKPSGTVPVKNARMVVAVLLDPAKSEAWVEDGSIAAAYMQLQACALGLGSCWVEVHGRMAADGTPSEQIVREVLGVPETLRALCLVTLGHPDEQRRPVDPAKLLWEKVHIGTWSDKSAQ